MPRSINPWARPGIPRTAHPPGARRRISGTATSTPPPRSGWGGPGAAPFAPLSFGLVDEALLDGSLEDAVAALRSRSVGAVELTEAALGRIAAREPELNAFITVTAEHARERARGADGRGALAGAPIALKDLFDVAGVPTTAGSKLFATN